MQGSSSATAERIEVAAMTLLTDAMWEDISTREVCAAANVSAPTLYHHFGDKTGLGVAVADRAFRTFFVGERSFAHSTDPVEMLRFAWDAHVEFGLTHRGLYSLMFGEGHADADLPGAVASRGVFREVLEQIADRGALLVPVERAALVLEGSLVGATFQALRSGLDIDVSHHLRDAVLGSLIADFDGRAPDTRSLAATAVQLDALLRSAGPTVLTSAETTLLQQWVGLLSGGSREESRVSPSPRPA